MKVLMNCTHYLKKDGKTEEIDENENTKIANIIKGFE